jgi:hypothetical protein
VGEGWKERERGGEKEREKKRKKQRKRLLDFN